MSENIGATGGSCRTRCGHNSARDVECNLPNDLYDIRGGREYYEARTEELSSSCAEGGICKR